MNPVFVAIIVIVAIGLMAAVAYASDCTTRCETVWGQTVCKTHCD